MARRRPHYRHLIFAIACSTIVASTGVAFTVEARPSRTPWITAASVLDGDTTESTGLFLTGAALIGLAATVRKISQPRPELLAKTGVHEMAAGER